jgi:NAD(P)-dependent dehydrogenase (short-subunit alcohol dehydrogenase family)
LFNLQEQIAIVTGAAGGIGRAIALRLSQEGAAVVAADLDGKAADYPAKEIIDAGNQALAVQMDVSAEKDAERMVKETQERLGPIDILVNNAGTGTTGLIVNHSVEDWGKNIGVNLRGTFLCSREVAKGMILRQSGVGSSEKKP